MAANAIRSPKYRRIIGNQDANAEVDTNLDVKGNLAVTGTTTLTGAVTASGDQTVSGDLTVTGTILGDKETEAVAATNVITAAESGKVFFLNLAGGFTSTLPAPAAGLNYKFIVTTAPTTAYVITTNAGDNVLQGTVATNGAETEVNGIDIANQDTINFVANQAKVGDYVEMVSDGTNWYVSGMVQDIANLTTAVT